MGEEKPLVRGVLGASAWYESTEELPWLGGGGLGGACESNQVGALGTVLWGEPRQGGAARKPSHWPSEHPCVTSAVAPLGS